MLIKLWLQDNNKAIDLLNAEESKVCWEYGNMWEYDYMWECQNTRTYFHRDTFQTGRKKFS